MNSEGFGYGGYRGPSGAVPAYAAPPPPPPPAAPQPPPAPLYPQGGHMEVPMPPLYGPLRGILNTAPPNQPFDQQPTRQTVRFGHVAGPPVTGGPGSESSVPMSLFSQMVLRLEKLERENEILMKVVMELNEVIEKERGNSFAVYTHPTIGTSNSGPPESSEQLPPWRIRK